MSGRDFMLDPATGDLLEEENQIRLTATLAESVAQQARIRSCFIKGEWFLDVREGLPLFEEILTKSPELQRIRSLYRQAYESIPGVVSVAFIDLDLNRSARELRVNWQASLTDGTVFRSEDFEPFVVEVI